jgi:hypothetical protein
MRSDKHLQALEALSLFRGKVTCKQLQPDSL